MKRSLLLLGRCRCAGLLFARSLLLFVLLGLGVTAAHEDLERRSERMLGALVELPLLVVMAELLASLPALEHLVHVAAGVLRALAAVVFLLFGRRRGGLRCGFRLR